MKIGMVSFAHMHAFSYAQKLKELDDVELVGIYDDDYERGIKAAKQFNSEFYHSYSDLLAQDIDAVLIASENAKHAEHVIEAAKAKKHVLCEKPLGITVESVQNMIDTCNENGVFLQVAFPVRFNTNISRAKQLIEEGKIGRILAVRGTNRGTNPGGWFVDPVLSGGGAVMDHTVHVVDIMRWITQSEIKEVYAEVDHHFSEKAIDDAGILTFEFVNGVFGTLDCSWSRNKTFPTWGDVTLEVVGTEGTLSVDAFGQYFNVYSNEDGANQQFWGDDMDAALIQDFVNNVRKNKRPTITGEDGLRAVEVALAAYKSSEQKAPVTIRL